MDFQKPPGRELPVLCAVYVQMGGTTSAPRWGCQTAKKWGGREQNRNVPSPVVQMIQILLKKAVTDDASGGYGAFWVASDCRMTVRLLNFRLKRSSCSLTAKDRHTLVSWIVAMKPNCNCFKYNSSWRQWLFSDSKTGNREEHLFINHKREQKQKVPEIL